MIQIDVPDRISDNELLDLIDNERPRVVEILAAAAMRDAQLVEVFERGEKAALREIEGMVVRREHRIETHPAQFFEILRVGARVRAM